MARANIPIRPTIQRARSNRYGLLRSKARGQKAPRLIGEGNQPAVSPKGGLVAFVRKGQVWSAPLDGRTAKKAEQLIHARGQNGGLQWSPDGARLAFVEQPREPQLRRRVRRCGEDGPLPGPQRGSRRCARMVARQPARGIPAHTHSMDEHRFFTVGAQRAAVVHSGGGCQRGRRAGKEVWKAAEGDGSVFRQLGSEQQLFWAGDRLVFPWERDGWTHLYSVSPWPAATRRLLTPGAFEVEHVAMTPDGREMVYSSNQDDIDRRHIWRVAAAGGRARRGYGRHGTGVVARGDRATARWSSSMRTPCGRRGPRYGWHPAKMRDLAPDAIPADFPKAMRW